MKKTNKQTKKQNKKNKQTKNKNIEQSANLQVQWRTKALKHYDLLVCFDLYLSQESVMDSINEAMQKNNSFIAINI